MVSFCFVAAPDAASKIGSDAGCQPKAKAKKKETTCEEAALANTSL